MAPRLSHLEGEPPRMIPISCRAALYKIPCRRILENSTERFAEYEYIVVKISFDDGTEGTGWTYTQGKGGTSVLHLINDYFAKEVTAKEVSDPVGLYNLLWAATYSYGLEGPARLAYGALDVALWDANAKAVELPLYVMLGASKKKKVKAYRSAIDLNYTEEELVADCLRFKGQGFTAFKIKVGKSDFREDLRRIETVRNAVGPDSILMVDANRKWTLKEAARKGKEFERLGLSWLEEPIEANLLDDYRHLSRKLGIPIAAGESLYNRSEAVALVAGKCVDVVQLDVLRVGGITEWIKLAHMAELLGLPMAPHFSEEIAVQVLCSIRNGIYLEHLPGSNLHDSGMLKNSFILRDGYAIPPERPGHGIEFDLDKLAQFESK